VVAVILGLAGPGPVWAHGVEEILADVRASTARYLDVAKAREDGYVQASGMEPAHGYHFLNVNAQFLTAATRLWSSQLDLGKPPILLYVERNGVWQLIGVEYALPGAPTDNPFPGARWSSHEASCHFDDYQELPAPRAAACPVQHPRSGARFAVWHPTMAVVHVWAWYPNPNGPFAEENPYLAPYGGQVAGHSHHGDNGADIAYSELNHRLSGFVLILVAAVALWESARPRPLPWRALPALAWVAFGIALFVRSDPEAWPWGPKGFLDIFADPLVFQHKILTLIPVVIGLVEGLRATGYLRASGWRFLFPALGLFGGAYLFLHFHDGTFHLDWIYLQHAAMGFASLGVGATLLYARRRPGWWILTRIWPAMLLVLGLILIFYSEA
jgi:uncharacterized protein (DUF952 family)